MTEPSLHISVRAGSDRRRVERLTDELRGALARDTDLLREGVRVAESDPGPHIPGSKGALETTATLVVIGQFFARPVADVLIAAIQGWCARDRRVSVDVSDGERTITIVGTPRPEHQQAIEEFFGSRDGGGRA